MPANRNDFKQEFFSCSDNTWFEPTWKIVIKGRTSSCCCQHTVIIICKSTCILKPGPTLKCGPALHYSVDLRIQTYTEPVPLKYGKPTTKYPWIYGCFFSSAGTRYVFLLEVWYFKAQPTTFRLGPVWLRTHGKISVSVRSDWRRRRKIFSF